VPALSPGPSSSPRAFNVGRATGWLAALNVAVHGARMLLLDPANDDRLVFNFAFAPELAFIDEVDLQARALALALRALASLFLHGDLTHLLVNMAFLLAFGTAVERRLGAARYVAFYLATGLAALSGAMALYWFAGESLLVLGASGAISGLFGAASRFYFAQARFAAGPLRRGPSGAALAVSFNLAFGLWGFDPMGGYRAIAWEVHIAGFAAGWLAFPLFDRGGA
jgi:membrane associated rhomboid family serine protease